MPEKLELWHCECGKWVLMQSKTAPPASSSRVHHNASKVHFEVAQEPIEAYYQSQDFAH